MPRVVRVARRRARERRAARRGEGGGALRVLCGARGAPRVALAPHRACGVRVGGVGRGRPVSPAAAAVGKAVV